MRGSFDKGYGKESEILILATILLIHGRMIVSQVSLGSFYANRKNSRA